MDDNLNEQFPEELEEQTPDIQQNARKNNFSQGLNNSMFNKSPNGLNKSMNNPIGKKEAQDQKGLAKRDKTPLGKDNSKNNNNPNTLNKDSSLGKNKEVGEEKQGLGSKIKDKLGKQGPSSKGLPGMPLPKNKEEAKGAAKEVAKQQIKQGIKTKIIALLKSPAGPYIIGIGAAVALIFFLIMFILLIVAGGEASASGAYTYKLLATEEMDFLCSMDNPRKEVNYRITSLYGWRVLGSATSSTFHHGIDLASGAGNPIYAVKKGTITKRYFDSNTGNTIVITHENNFKTYYYHMSSFQEGIEVGDTVSQGELIGLEGTTGNSTGNHLHFGIKNASDQYFSPNVFFGFSDEGSEDCVNEGTSVSLEKGNSCESRATTVDFKQLCQSRTNATEGDASSAATFIGRLEGTTPSCTIEALSRDGYTATNIGDGTITVGPGVTNHVFTGNQTYAKMIEEYKVQSLFSKQSDGSYILINGNCYPQNLINSIKSIIVTSKIEEVRAKATAKGATLTEYQIHALTSFAYQGGNSGLDSLLDAYNNYQANGYSNKYEGIWSKMKLYFNPGTKFEDGLKRRRKAEFALFVTGDYTDQGKFYSRNIDNYDNYDSEGVMSRIAE